MDLDFDSDIDTDYSEPSDMAPENVKLSDISQSIQSKPVEHAKHCGSSLSPQFPLDSKKTESENKKPGSGIVVQPHSITVPMKQIKTLQMRRDDGQTFKDIPKQNTDEYSCGQIGKQTDDGLENKENTAETHADITNVNKISFQNTTGLNKKPIAAQCPTKSEGISLTLADLAKKHDSQTDKTSSLSLSELARLHQVGLENKEVKVASVLEHKNTVDGMRTGQDENLCSGRVQSGPLGIDNLGKSAGSSLSDLAKAHAVGISLSESSKPANKKFSQSGDNKLLSDLAKAHGVGSSLSDLARAHGVGSSQSDSSKPTGIGKSLSDLAKAHGVSSGSNIPSASQGNKTSPGLGVSGSPIGTTLADLAQAHGVQKTQKTMQNEPKGSVKSDVSSLAAPQNGLLVTSDVHKNNIDIMQSLTSLVNKMKPTGGIVVKPHRATRSAAEMKAELKNQMLASRECEKHSYAGNFSVKKAEGQKINSVDKLAEKSAVLNLTDLVKDRNSLTRKNITHNKEAIKTAKPNDMENISREKETSFEVHTDDIVHMNKLEEMFKQQLGINEENRIIDVKYLLKSPSSIGKTLCHKMAKVKQNQSKDSVRYRKKHFRYSHQVRNLKKGVEVKLSKITPFDFSTPSPDDVVKEKQKLAFNRSGK